MIGFELATLIGGAIVTETIFAWPGVGRLLCSRLRARLPVVQAAVLRHRAVRRGLEPGYVDLVYV